MPRDLFGDVPHPSVHVGSRSRYTVPLSLAAHALAVLAIAGATIFGPVVLPGLASSDLVYVTLPPPPAPPLAPPAGREPVRPAVNPDAAPTVAPDTIAPERPQAFDAPDLPSTLTGVIVGTSAFDTIVGEPPAPPPPAPQPPIRVGGQVRPPAKVHDVAPVYPAVAQAARIQGTVILEATIGVDGRVQAARVLRPVPFLDEAALTAVRQWIYTPTLLNGVPVPVVMTVTVTFRLN